MKEHLLRLFRYETWANRRCLQSMAALQDPGAAIRLFGHILGAQRVWLARIRKEEVAQFDVWPQPQSVTDSEQMMQEVGVELERYLDALTESELSRTIAYTPTFLNPRRREFHNTPTEILTHVAMHSTYHRGQIAVRVRDAGAEPAATDFMIYLRELEAGED